MCLIICIKFVKSVGSSKWEVCEQFTFANKRGKRNLNLVNITVYLDAPPFRRVETYQLLGRKSFIHVRGDVICERKMQKNMAISMCFFRTFHKVPAL